MTPAPGRTCLGCRRVRPKDALIRLVRASDGRVVLDYEARARGRGAYVCPSVECLGKALARSRLGHAFRQPSEPPAVSPAAIRERWGGR